jgi:hypothetical protein
MRVLVAGATGTIGVPLVRALVARGHRVHGLTRDPANRRLLTGLGAEPIVADALDRGALLAAVQRRAADAVLHQLTALKKPPARHRDMAQTTPCGPSAPPTCWRRPQRLAPAAWSPSRWSSGTAMGTTARNPSPRTTRSGRPAAAGSPSPWPRCAQPRTRLGALPASTVWCCAMGCVTGPAGPALGQQLEVECSGGDGKAAVGEVTTWERTFGRVPVGASLLLIESEGQLSFADNQGDAARRLGLSVGQAVRIAGADRGRDGRRPLPCPGDLASALGRRERGGGDTLQRRRAPAEKASARRSTHQTFPPPSAARATTLPPFPRAPIARPQP